MTVRLLETGRRPRLHPSGTLYPSKSLYPCAAHGEALRPPLLRISGGGRRSVGNQQRLGS